jgi:signal transduction histidine kinase
MSKLPIRRRLLLAVILTVGAALAALIVGFNLLLAHNLSSDANSLARTRAVSELGVVAIRHGNLVVVETPDDVAPDSFVWVFSHKRLVESPAASSGIAAAARRLAATAPGFADVPGASTRLYATPVVVNGKRYGSVVGGISLKPYDQTRKTALLASLGFGAVVLLLVAIAGRWLLLKSLTPVARMTRLVGEWSDRDLDRRFDVTAPRDELTDLATTLDGLLDRLAASLRREQRFSAEVSHELRTPLSRVIAEADLALRRERTSGEYRNALELIRQNAHQLARTIEALVAAARHEAGGVRGTADALSVAKAAVEAGIGLDGHGEIDVRVVPPDRPVRLGVDGELAARVLQPVLENACRYGHTAVSVTMSRQNTDIVYRIVDDGPGVNEHEKEQIFEPGWRGNMSPPNGDGAGLGLALARRLARSVSGDVTATAAQGGGTFIVTLPAAR